MANTDTADLQETGTNRLLDAALGYLSLGWAVVPAAKRAKYPIVSWKKYQGTPADRAQIHKWFADHPDLNISVVTGVVSGIVVVDVDPRHGGDRSLQKLEARHGGVPNTVESRTGGGGRHLYFAYPDVEVRNRAGMAAGIDVRGEGGVIVVPPSIHPSGVPYTWQPGQAPGDIELALMPDWLLTLALGESQNDKRDVGS